MPTPVFDETTLRKFDQLSLAVSRARAGQHKGERRSTKKGNSVEFADYRNYVRGDDLRRLDWNLYARLQRPFIKLFEEEEDLAVHILLDTSGSMHWPVDVEYYDPEEAERLHKFRYLQHLAGSLAYIALNAGDRLSISTLQSAEQATQHYGPVRSKGHTLSMLNFVQSLQAVGEVKLGTSLTAYARSANRTGLCILLTDMLTTDDYLPGLKALRQRGFDVVLLHLLSPDEEEPQFAGEVRLVDVETGVGQELSLHGGLMNLYQERVSAWQAEIAQACQQLAVHHISLNTNLPWEQFVLTHLRQRGILI